jgi:hypothetical protein
VSEQHMLSAEQQKVYFAISEKAVDTQIHFK